MFRLVRSFLNIFRPVRSLNVTFDSGGFDRPTIVLLHGIAATSKTWEYLIQELDTDKFRVVVLDLLGFGDSPKPVSCNYDVDDHIRYIRSTLKRLEIRRINKLVGHSMGSIIAARYARYYPKEVNELYLLSLPLYLNDEHPQTYISRRRTDMYLDSYEFLANKKEFTINASKNLRKIFRPIDGGEVTEENWRAFRLSLKNTIINQDAYRDIRDITIPVHVVYGVFDEVLIPESLDRLVAFENVKITRLRNVNHMVGSRYAHEVARIISQSS